MDLREKKRQANREYYLRNKRRLKKKAALAYKRTRELVVYRYPRHKYLKNLGIEANRLKKRVVILNDKEVRVYTISEFCNFIGKAIQTVRKWEKSGLVPPPLLQRHGPRQWRLYTEGEVQLFAETLDITRNANAEFQDMIWDGYVRLRKEYGFDKEKSGDEEDLG